MTLYLISNNELLNNIVFDDDINIEDKKSLRALTIKGEELAKNNAKKININDDAVLISSYYNSSISTAKYFCEGTGLGIYLSERLDDCKIGDLGSNNLKMLSFMQEHNFDFKNPRGESLNDVSRRVNKLIDTWIDKTKNLVLFTSKRVILSYLIKVCNTGYNLNDRLILDYKEKIIYSDELTEFDIIKVVLSNSQVEDIERIMI